MDKLTLLAKNMKLSKTEQSYMVSAALVEKFCKRPFTSCEEFIFVIFHRFFV